MLNNQSAESASGRAENTEPSAAKQIAERYQQGESMADSISDARKKIEARLDELRAEEEKLNRALVHLTGTSASRASKPKQRRGTTRKRAKRGQREQEVIDDISANPGAKASETASRTGMSSGQVSGIHLRLKKSGRLTPRADGGYVVRSQAEEK